MFVVAQVLVCCCFDDRLQSEQLYSLRPANSAPATLAVVAAAAAAAALDGDEVRLLAKELRARASNSLLAS